MMNKEQQNKIKTMAKPLESVAIKTAIIQNRLINDVKGSTEVYTEDSEDGFAFLPPGFDKSKGSTSITLIGQQRRAAMARLIFIVKRKTWLSGGSHKAT